ncbi:hypothetical protein FRB91_007575 [Serendipita sp. 411]|nr:hypothetical protein FRB91_007575 [Serendipita sp. 411]
MAQTAWNFQEMNQRLDSLDVNGQSTQENQHTFPQSRGMTGVTHHPSDRGGTTSVPSSASYERSEFLGVPVPSYSGSRPRVSSFTSGSNTNTGFIYTSPDDQYRSNEPVPGGGSSQAVVTKEERTSTITPPPIWDDNRLGSYQTAGLVPQAPRARALSGPARARPSTSPRSQSQRTSPPVPTFPPPLNVPHNSDFGATLYDSPSTPHTYHPGSTSFVRAAHQPTLSMPLPNPSENVYQSLAYGGYVSSIPPMAQRTQNVGFESDFQPPSHPRVSESSRPPPNSRTTLAPVAIAPPLKRQTRKPHGSVHACISLYVNSTSAVLSLLTTFT